MRTGEDRLLFQGEALVCYCVDCDVVMVQPASTRRVSAGPARGQRSFGRARNSPGPTVPRQPSARRALALLPCGHSCQAASAMYCWFGIFGW